MSDLAAWLKEQLRKSAQLKELIKTHTGLAPPAFFAVVALAAAGTALTVSAVSSLFSAPKKSDKALDAIIEEEILPYTPSNPRKFEVLPVVIDTPDLEETKEEEEAPVTVVEPEDVAAVEVLVEEEEEEKEKDAAPATVNGEDNISSDYVETFEEESII